MTDNDKRCSSGNNQPMPGAYIDASGRYIDEWGHPVEGSALVVERYGGRRILAELMANRVVVVWPRQCGKTEMQRMAAERAAGGGRKPMSVNVLSARRTAAIGRTLGKPVVWAWVLSHHNSGRYVFITTADHEHGWYDRATEEYEIDDNAHHASCRILFCDDPEPGEVERRASDLRANRTANQWPA